MEHVEECRAACGSHNSYRVRAQSGGLFNLAHIARFRYASNKRRLVSLHLPLAYLIVLGENDPAPFTYSREPFLVWDISAEVIFQ